MISGCYDAASRVPPIFHWSGHLAPSVRPELISNVDVAPTLLDFLWFAGAEGDARPECPAVIGEQGREMADFVVIENRPFKEINQGMMERCVVTPKWKLAS